MACIEQLMAEAESITVVETDDEVLLRATKLLAEHRRMLAGWFSDAHSERLNSMRALYEPSLSSSAKQALAFADREWDEVDSSTLTASL